MLIYHAEIDTLKHVHDGDSIDFVYFKLDGVHADAIAMAKGELFPDVYVDTLGNVWIHTNIRIAGIDCAELHPRHRLPNGYFRSTAEISHERKLAIAARQVVVDAFDESLSFEIRNPQFGKYAGRTVAEVWIQGVDIAQRLLDKGLAYPYSGGTKRRWTKADPLPPPEDDTDGNT